MKHGPSLEDERRALLEHIHATRAAYRRMLTETDEDDHVRHETGVHFSTPDAAFPRSMTMKWIIEHPYAIAGAALAAAVLAPRAIRMVNQWRIAMSRSPVLPGNPFASRASAAVPRADSYPLPEYRSSAAPGMAQARGYDVAGQPLVYGRAGGYVRPGIGPKLLVTGRAAVTGLATAAAMVARDPAKRQMAMRLFTIASAYLAKRRADKKEVQEARRTGVPVHKS